MFRVSRAHDSNNAIQLETFSGRLWSHCSPPDPQNDEQLQLGTYSFNHFLLPLPIYLFLVELHHCKGEFSLLLMMLPSLNVSLEYTSCAILVLETSSRLSECWVQIVAFTSMFFCVKKL
jgi:hypothetical protein